MHRAQVYLLLAVCFAVLPLHRMCMAQLETPKPIVGVPFTAFETVRKTQGTDVYVSTGTIARRSDGSIYWNLVTKKNEVEIPSIIILDDAAKHVALELYVWLHQYTSDPWQASDFVFHPISAEQYLKRAGGEGAKRTFGEINQYTTLGIRQIAGLQTVGTHLERPIGTIETWYSPELDMNLERKAHEAKPGGEDALMAIQEVRLGEPDPKLFEVPPGYTLVDRKTLVHGSPAPAK